MKTCRCSDPHEINNGSISRCGKCGLVMPTAQNMAMTDEDWELKLRPHLDKMGREFAEAVENWIVENRKRYIFVGENKR